MQKTLGNLNKGTQWTWLCRENKICPPPKANVDGVFLNSFVTPGAYVVISIVKSTNSLMLLRKYELRPFLPPPFFSPSSVVLTALIISEAQVCQVSLNQSLSTTFLSGARVNYNGHSAALYSLPQQTLFSPPTYLPQPNYI